MVFRWLAAGLFLLPTLLSAQPSLSWSVRHDEGGFEQAGCATCFDNFLGFKANVRGRQAIAADAAGNVYVTGVTTAGATEDVLTVKYNSQGVMQWAVTYDGGEADQGFAVTVDASGNVYVTGRSWTETQYGLHGYLLAVKYNASGVQQWATRYVSGVLSAGFAVAVDGSGNAYVAGEYYSGSSDLHSMFTVKVNAAGAIQWTRLAFYGYDYEESSAYDLALDGSGNAYVTGFLYKPGDPGIRDYLTVKYSPSGAGLWAQAYETGGIDEAYDVAVDGSGNVHVAGTSGVVRYSSAGAQQWVGAFDGVAHALINAGGFVYATGVSGTDIVTARYDGTGTRLWSTAYNLGGDEQAFALRLVGNTLYVAGFSGTDALVVGFDKDLGSSSWFDLYDSGADDRAYSMAFTGTSDFWVGGTSGGDYLTVKYTVPVQSGPSLLSLTLTPATIAGGCKTSTGKVTLTGPAPAGGAVVQLGNTNPAATVPSSVTVPAGATSAKFTITSTTVTASQTGTVTAIYGGVSKSSTLTVRPIGVLGLALSPNPVVGPNGVVGTVTLECPAAPGSIVVTLTTSNAAVAKPAVTSITIPAGSATGTFNVTTTDVSAVSYANIRATASGVWKAVKLTVNP